MVYLEYHKKTKQVIEIHETQPTVSVEYDFAIAEQFIVGDEFEQTIWVNDVDNDKNLVSYSAIRNNPNAKRLLQENEQLKSDLASTKSELESTQEAVDFLLMGGM